MEKKQALEKLAAIGQPQLLDFFEELTPSQQADLLRQIDSLSTPFFRRQQQLLIHPPHQKLRLLEPFRDSVTVDQGRWQEQGKTLLKEGKAGCLIIAGGQGSRLKFEGPKGCFPVTAIEQKSLFQLFAEKTVAAGQQIGRTLPLAIMTSPQNHATTVQFFKEHHYFGLSADQISFFIQGTLPLLDAEGNLFLEAKDLVAQGPDGNGSVFTHFIRSGIWNTWYQQGVRLLNVVLIDNPLADPFDAALLGFHHDFGVDAVVKCTERQDEDEKVGVLALHQDKAEVIEYTEMPTAERKARTAQGDLKFPLANLSLFSFSMDFVKSVSQKEIPLHLAHKAVKSLKKPQSAEPNAWKFEAFIFDVLPMAFSVKALVYPREKCFAPLKNASGPDSPATVKAALLKRDREVFQELSGTEPPERAFELSQEFYYPTPELRDYWKGRNLPDNSYYINAT